MSRIERVWKEKAQAVLDKGYRFRSEQELHPSDKERRLNVARALKAEYERGRQMVSQ